MASTESKPSFPRLALLRMVSADQSSILFDSRSMYVNALIFELDWKSVSCGVVDEGV